MNPNDKAEWWFVFLLLVGLIVMGLVFAIGHVQESTSYGLKEILETLRALTGIAVGYKFGKTIQFRKEDEEKIQTANDVQPKV